MTVRGFTLMELLVSLAVAATLSSLAYPAFDNLLAQIHSTSRVNDLVGMIRFARHAAISERRWVALCPAEGDWCTNSADWHTGIMGFEDRNRDGERQPEEPILAYLSRLDPGEQLRWRSFRRRNYLQFRAEGYTNWQNGSFLYCPASGDPRYGKVLIVNIQGRTTPSVDTDGDGIDEQANGNPLAC